MINKDLDYKPDNEIFANWKVWRGISTLNLRCHLSEGSAFKRCFHHSLPLYVHVHVHSSSKETQLFLFHFPWWPWVRVSNSGSWTWPLIYNLLSEIATFKSCVSFEEGCNKIYKVSRFLEWQIDQCNGKTSDRKDHYIAERAYVPFMGRYKW